MGTGDADVFAGSLGVLTFDVAAYNARRSLIVLVKLPGSRAAVVEAFRLRVYEARLVAGLPRLPLGAGFEGGLVRLALDVPALGARSRPYLRTPWGCPSAGAWRARVAGVFDPPVKVHGFADASPCRTDARLRRAW